jgi:UDP-3-O-[3-hydroxymyristoyl] glucosamine N-acyltransferase
MIVNIIIIGAGAIGREVYSLIQDINAKKKQFNILGFLDDNLEKGTIIRDLKVLGSKNEIGSYDNASYVIAISNPVIRKQIFEMVKSRGANLPNLIHPLAKIDFFCKTNWDGVEGNIICAYSILSCDVKLGNNNYINFGVILSHDTVIGDNNIIMQGCILNGSNIIADECILLPGLVINNKI